MIFKSFLLEKDLSLIDDYRLILFYGENIGLKDEFKINLKKNFPIMSIYFLIKTK